MAKIKNIIKIIQKEFVYGGHLQCLGVVGIAYIAGFLLNIKADFLLFAIIYLLFYLIYINDRRKGIKIDRLTNPERTDHIEKYFDIMSKIILFLFLLLIFLLIYLNNFKFLIFILLLLILGILYPFYFKKLTKKIAIFKNIYVAAFFATIVFSPIIYHRIFLDFLSFISLLILMLFIFFKTFLMQIFLDCKDVEIDKIAKLKTLPVIIGRNRTFIFLKKTNIYFTFIFLFFAVFIFPVFPFQTLSLLLIVPLNLYSYKLAREEKYLGYILGSSEFFFWLLFIVVTLLII